MATPRLSTVKTATDANKFDHQLVLNCHRISVDNGDVTCLDVGCCVGQNNNCSGFQANEPCFCDVACETYSDCCPDYAACFGKLPKRRAPRPVAPRPVAPRPVD